VCDNAARFEQVLLILKVRMASEEERSVMVVEDRGTEGMDFCNIPGFRVTKREKT
jgi:hypothetical protein